MIHGNKAGRQNLAMYSQQMIHGLSWWKHGSLQKSVSTA